MDRRKDVCCSICNKTYSTTSNLKKHVKKYHPTKLNKVLSYYKNSKNFNYTCDCGKNFNYLHHFRSHRRIHEESLDNCKFTRKKCPLCDYARYKKSEMLNHFRDVHKINIEIKEYKLSSIEQFNSWKLEMETSSSSSYIKNAKSRNHDIIYYCCHRSGSYIPKGKGVRQLKTKGTNKINAYCPAGIKLNQSNDGSCKVLLIDNHIGHEADIGYLQLTQVERQDLAIKITNGLSYDKIIEETRQSAHQDHVKRIHLLNRKDLHNIETRFKKSTAIGKQSKETDTDISSMDEENITNNVQEINTPDATYNCSSSYIQEMSTQGNKEVQDSRNTKDSELDAMGTNSCTDNLEKLEEKKKKLLAEFSKYLNCISSTEELENFKAVIISYICNH